MKRNFLRGISANVLLLGGVSFLNDLSSEMIMPILPMFITSLGGAGLAIGFIGGLRDAISSILQIVCGYWSDRTGKRKPFVFSGYLSSAVFKLLLAFARAYPSAMLFAALERVGKGLRTAARDAIIADSMKSNTGKGFGIHRGFDSAGAILGSIAAFLLVWFLNVGFKLIILIAAIFALVSLIPLHFVKETGTQTGASSLKISFRQLPRSVKVFVLIAGVFALGNFSYMFFVLRAQQLLTGRLSVALPILLYVLFNIFYMIFALPFGALSDKVGKEKVIILGYVLFSLTCFGFAWFTSKPALAVLFALYGIANAAVDGSQRAFVSDLSSQQLRATILGTFHTVISFAALAAGLTAGVLWESIGPHATFLFGGLVGSLAAFLLGVCRRFMKV